MLTQEIIDKMHEVRLDLDAVPAKKERAVELADILRESLDGFTDRQLGEVASFIDLYWGTALEHAVVREFFGTDPVSFLASVRNEFLDAAILLVTDSESVPQNDEPGPAAVDAE